LARKFTTRHRANWRYVPAWGRWLEWRDGTWRFDEVCKVFDLARTVCREAAAAFTKESLQVRIGSAATVAAVLRLAQSDPIHTRTVDVWDRDPWLLNTPGGTVDLR